GDRHVEVTRPGLSREGRAGSSPQRRRPVRGVLGASRAGGQVEIADAPPWRFRDIPSGTGLAAGSAGQANVIVAPPLVPVVATNDPPHDSAANRISASPRRPAATAAAPRSPGSPGPSSATTNRTVA